MLRIVAVQRLRERGGLSVPSRLDSAVAVAAAALMAGGSIAAAWLQETPRPLDAGALALVVVAGLALAWRRQAPVVVLTVVVALVGVYVRAGYPYGPIQLSMVFAMFEVARLRGLQVSLLACAAAVAASVAALLTRTASNADEPLLLSALWASWLVVPWSVGALVHVRTAAAQRARRELVARAALEERMRVAREVHDIAGHGFAAVAMQAGVGLLVLDEQPAQAKASLEAIKTTSTKALTDLRALLDAFRQGADVNAEPVEPREGLGEVAALVESVRAAGLPVRISAEPIEVPAEVGRVAYRVLQEALTNVLRHAGPATAEVCVQRERDLLIVEVSDRGVGAEELRPGLGLIGMRNRVSAVGGELVTETRKGGGFKVSARLPIVRNAT
jgi:signal transduction histidine kinase